MTKTVHIATEGDQPAICGMIVADQYPLGLQHLWIKEDQMTGTLHPSMMAKTYTLCSVCFSDPVYDLHRLSGSL